MKKIAVSLIIFVMALTLVMSCKKEDTGDGTIPEIVILGSNPLYWAIDYPYDDPGATAFDITSEGDTVDISARVETISNVDVTVEGDYEVKYNVTDESGLSAEEKVRKVTVVVGK